MTIEKIKEEILENIKENICYFYKNINVSDIEKIMNKISDSEYKSKIVKREVKIDKEKLFKNKVSNIIKYLSSYKDYELCECLGGFVFVKDDFETYDEIILRMEKNILCKCKALSEKRKEELSLKKKKKELNDKIAYLNKQY